MRMYVYRIAGLCPASERIDRKKNPSQNVVPQAPEVSKDQPESPPTEIPCHCVCDLSQLALCSSRQLSLIGLLARTQHEQGGISGPRILSTHTRLSHQSSFGRTDRSTDANRRKLNCHTHRTVTCCSRNRLDEELEEESS
ncbi:hypothetical protein PHSY_005109 [Pseudozyma hubeiensis SY62]|uniref:Uncharacterized protein n=1 Tax=Pseudozyma hubeiensis (strain SY62) TaxID=1305764 RepID=R9P7Z4_PSEHS|nr:hypothetical protein PHSY_005109 [Pseudozyma hubeiensis SY62]GAC97523.1 hypothetical protein PHSY_005109 [Pseudozyma hubeiensis SY62]